MENVYAQHVPLMMTTVEAALKSKIKENVYPSIGPAVVKPQEVREVWGHYVVLLMRGHSFMHSTSALTGHILMQAH